MWVAGGARQGDLQTGGPLAAGQLAEGGCPGGGFGARLPAAQPLPGPWGPGAQGPRGGPVIL